MKTIDDIQLEKVIDLVREEEIKNSKIKTYLVRALNVVGLGSFPYFLFDMARNNIEYAGKSFSENPTLWGVLGLYSAVDLLLWTSELKNNGGRKEDW